MKRFGTFFYPVSMRNFFLQLSPSAEHCDNLDIKGSSVRDLKMCIITIIIFIPITQQPEQDRLAENQPTAGLSK